MHQVRRRATDSGHPQVLHQFKLAFGIAHRGRNHRGTDTLCPVVHPQTAGKKPVSIRHLHHIPPTDTTGREGTCERLAPVVEIVFGVAYDSRLSGRSR